MRNGDEKWGIGNGEWLHHAPATDLCKLPVETSKIDYLAFVCRESKIFLLHDILASLQPLVWLVKLVKCLKTFSTDQTFTILQNKIDICSKLGNQLWACLSLDFQRLLQFGKGSALEARRL